MTELADAYGAPDRSEFDCACLRDPNTGELAERVEHCPTHGRNRKPECICEDPFDVLPNCPKCSEKVNHPAHYGGEDDPYEAIKVIEAWDLGFHTGNTVKYICRSGKKGSELEDLKKARWYLDRAITNMETPKVDDEPF